ncbi:hypothetical protein EG68_00824 [Paragonimus skrjabini miyazakii]|uniref:Uncharacterized protein n=1 Tax=Paragonimus skrjabini miyazakii TaxID=59628 RepID=A0A8S9Z5C0_9TREM|nr:hypothetical protein EG68_00824 [Paragonimus skrjabini miyazakii]
MVMASEESKFHSYARRPLRQLHSIASQKRAHSLTDSINTAEIFRTSAASTCGNGYLLVTGDRICFTTGPGCARPRLLATWSFGNDDLVQCGAALGKRVDDLDDSGGMNQVSLFFLTVSPNHADAPGRHLFTSGRTAELFHPGPPPPVVERPFEDDTSSTTLGLTDMSHIPSLESRPTSSTPGDTGLPITESEELSTPTNSRFSPLHNACVDLPYQPLVSLRIWMD